MFNSENVLTAGSIKLSIEDSEFHLTGQQMLTISLVVLNLIDLAKENRFPKFENFIDEIFENEVQ